MEMRGSMNGDWEDALIWVEVDVAATPQYEIWRDSPWYASVDWAEASRIAFSLVTLGGVEFQPIPEDLDHTIEEAVGSLLYFPIDSDSEMIYNGGHRLSAMKQQGVSKTLGKSPRPKA
jgi:hypothetical protein